MLPHVPMEHLDVVAAVEAGLSDLEAGALCVVACSGGPDSLALLEAASLLQRRLGIRLQAVYVDHQLRPAARAEAAFVSRLAAARGLDATTVKVDVARRAAGEGRSLMEAARLERYEALDQVAESLGAHRVLLGHTRDDQVETVIMRLWRGTGLRGLAGIPPRRGRYHRPLLAVSRDAIEEFLRARGLTPVRDPSNEDRRFTRSVVRHDLLPAMRRRTPSLDERLLRLAAAARTRIDAIDVDLDRREREAPAPLTVASLRADPPDVRRTRLERACRRAGGGGLLSVHVAAAEQLLRSEEGTRGIDLPGGLRLERRYETVVVFRPSQTTGQPRSVALSGPGTYRLRGWHFTVEEWRRDDLRGGASWERGVTADTARFDVDRLRCPVLLRLPMAGDRIRPRGFGHRRRVFDLLGEARVPVSERWQRPLLADSCEVLWVPGIRCSEIARPGPETTHGVVVRVRSPKPEGPSLTHPGGMQ